MFLPALLLLFSPAFQGQDPTLTPTAGAVTVATAEGRGVQIYQCKIADNGTYSWTFLTPEATLTEPSSGKTVGTHGKGPSWTWNDGSSITGTVMAKMTSPDAGSIPWLLLKTTPAGTGNGFLSNVGLVRRSDTKGGDAPLTGCDTQHANAVRRVPYSATYTFYSVATSPTHP